MSTLDCFENNYNIITHETKMGEKKKLIARHLGWWAEKIIFRSDAQRSTRMN